ncbi:hypothetical protein P1X14_17135 [Sphingomonas sp. AOB5]|uniref:hypothetical protein n=1 Tax=Sphingomonas sp. AOB5 TaxID=3034017 RepID=UPI0023FA20C8|nr:hypothetical protein [Sphingomonas sp. AOB5]MDF7776984.1 hypothetical protein [Sphingomonas sp. AOB5]
MLLALMLFAAQDPETAVEAERAFNRSAQTEGQWTAFRKYSTPDAVIFTPQPVKAHEALPKADPKITVQWWPAQSYVSCDGTMAVNTGPWVRPKGVGYFTTVWARQDDGHYKWVYDGGDALTTPRALPEKPQVRTASCSGKPTEVLALTSPSFTSGGGQSEDGSLVYHWIVTPEGARRLDVHLWNGQKFDVVLTDRIAAAPAQ